MRFRASVLDSLAAELETAGARALVQSRARRWSRSLLQNLQAARHRPRGLPARHRADRRGAGRVGAAQAEDAVRKDLALEAVADAEGIEVTDEMVEAWVREQSAEGDEDPDEAVERLLGDPATTTALRADLAAQKALDIVVEHAKPITPEQAEAKDKLWTPEQESDAPGEKPTPIWTPAGAGGST